MSTFIYERPLLPEMPELLTAWFYDPASDHQGWMNKLIAMLDAPFCHVELQFPDSTACTVYMGSEVVMKQRSFNNACYSGIDIPCTKAQCVAARRAADRLHAERLRCSALDMTSCIFGVEMCENRTFCSKLVAQILCESDLLPTSFDFKTVSPSRLHQCLRLQYPESALPRKMYTHPRAAQQKRMVSFAIDSSKAAKPAATPAQSRASTPVQAIDFRVPSQSMRI